MAGLDGGKRLDWNNSVEKRKGSTNKFLEWVKKTLWALAATVTIAQWVNAKEINLGNVQNLQEVKQICAKVAEDIDGNVYNVNIPAKLYEPNIDAIMNNFPDNEGCTYIVTTKWENGYVVKYTSAFWDTDASDVVAKETAEAEQAQQRAEQASREDEKVWTRAEEAKKEAEEAKKEAEKAKKEVEKMKKMVKAKWYLWDLQEKVILMWENINNSGLVNSTLDSVLGNLKVWNLKWNKYGKNIKMMLEIIKSNYFWSDKNIVNKVNILLRKLNLD